MADVTTREGRAELRSDLAPFTANRAIPPLEGYVAELRYLLDAADERDRLRAAIQAFADATAAFADFDGRMSRPTRSDQLPEWQRLREAVEVASKGAIAALSPSGDTPAGAEGERNG